LASSLLKGEKAETKTAKGVSSTIISAPVAASKALIFLPA